MAALKDSALVHAVVEDFRTAPIDERLRAALAFVEKLSSDPRAVGAADVQALRAVGLADDAIRDAVYVAFCFGVITRIADALDFPVSDERAGKWVGRILARIGYDAGSLPG